VSSLEFLKGMPLYSLNLEGTPVANVSVIGAMPFRYLNLKRTPFSDMGTDR